MFVHYGQCASSKLNKINQFLIIGIGIYYYIIYLGDTEVRGCSSYDSRAEFKISLPDFRDS